MSSDISLKRGVCFLMFGCAVNHTADALRHSNLTHFSEGAPCKPVSLDHHP